MVFLDLILPTAIEIEEDMAANIEPIAQNNMFIPIVTCLVVVAVIVVITSKTIISKELKNAK